MNLFKNLRTRTIRLWVRIIAITHHDLFILIKLTLLLAISLRYAMPCFVLFVLLESTSCSSPRFTYFHRESRPVYFLDTIAFSHSITLIFAQTIAGVITNRIINRSVPLNFSDKFSFLLGLFPSKSTNLLPLGSTHLNVH